MGKKQILAANIDLVAVVASIKSPPLRRGFLDRALASATWNGIPAALVLNKVDLIPYLKFDMELLLENIRRVNSRLRIVSIAATVANNLDPWIKWLEMKTQNPATPV